MCDYGPPEGYDCPCKNKEKKSDRRCNNCGERLNEYSPNWFQCSYGCMKQRWDTCHPTPSEDEY